VPATPGNEKTRSRGGFSQTRRTYWDLAGREGGAGGGNRTPDLSLTKRLLYQLSYTGTGARSIGNPDGGGNAAAVNRGAGAG
jgi:hypothetical protein